MTKSKIDYKLLVGRISKTLSQTPEELARWVDISERYIRAASDLSKDELALIEAYLKRDLSTFADHYHYSQKNELENEVFRNVIANSLWEQLAEITDKTQLEWKEILRDFEHHGIYYAGEVVGLGRLTCEQCGHQSEHYQVHVLTPCIKCKGIEFTRNSLDK